MVGHVVEDEVVALLAAGEVLLGVVDDVVGPDGVDQVHVSGAAHAGHLGSQCLGNLHREGADAAGGAVDQDFLPSFYAAVVANGLEGDEAGHWYGCGLLTPPRGRSMSMLSTTLRSPKSLVNPVVRIEVMCCRSFLFGS